MIPKDPMILLSYVNTQLRDYYDSLEALCAEHHALFYQPDGYFHPAHPGRDLYRGEGLFLPRSWDPLL